MKFKTIEVSGWQGAIRGMRNPLESWAKSDSKYLDTRRPEIGPNDLDLAQRLIKGGSEHRKFLRYIHVQVDITAPLFWFKEFDTYKVGTVANSTSTMHKLASTAITLDCFEIDDYAGNGLSMDKDNMIDTYDVASYVDDVIYFCEQLRQKYLETKDVRYWKELIRWLPESWLQTRTVDLNYEVLRTIVHQRKGHKLPEWSSIDPDRESFMNWISTLPYANELILFEN